MSVPTRGTPAAAPTPFPAGLVAGLEFADFEAMAAAARGWDQQYLKLAPGAFRGAISMAHTSRMQVATADWSCGVLSVGSVPKAARTFALVSARTAPARHGGQAVRGDQLATASDRDELHFLHPQGCSMVVFSLAHDLLDEMAATFLGESWREAAGAGSVLDVRDPSLLQARLRQLIASAFAGDPARLRDVSASETPLQTTFRLKLNGQTVSIGTVGQAFRFITSLSAIEWMEFRALHEEAMLALQRAAADGMLTVQATAALRTLFVRAKLL